MFFAIRRSAFNPCCLAMLAIYAAVAFGQAETQTDEGATPKSNADASTQYLHQIALANAEVLGKQFSVAEAILKKCPPELRRWEWHYLQATFQSPANAVSSAKHRDVGSGVFPRCRETQHWCRLRRWWLVPVGRQAKFGKLIDQEPAPRNLDALTRILQYQ